MTKPFHFDSLGLCSQSSEYLEAKPCNKLRPTTKSNKDHFPHRARATFSTPLIVHIFCDSVRGNDVRPCVFFPYVSSGFSNKRAACFAALVKRYFFRSFCLSGSPLALPFFSFFFFQLGRWRHLARSRFTDFYR